jgi:nucleoside-diphosphate-sugar epimerase
MRVLITGGAGFLGAQVVRRLVAAGVEVHAIVRAASDRSRLREVERHVNFVEADLRDTAQIARQVAMVRPGIVFHLAWVVTPGAYLDSDENLDMLTAGVHLARAAAGSGCERFVGAGTCLEYAPQAEPMREDTPARPTTLYAASKLAFSLVLEQLSKTSGMAFVWPRLFFLYGPMEDERRLVPGIIRSLEASRPPRLRNADAARDFLHTEDAASALWALATSDVRGVVNVGSSQAVTVRHVSDTLADILDRRGVEPVCETGSAEPAHVCADTTLLRATTGWAPRYTLTEGLHQTVGWWRGRDRQLMQES